MSEILGVVFAAMVAMYMLPGLFAPQKATNDTVRQLATAQQQKQVYAAAAQYIEQNAGTIQASATATSPVVITVPMLQAAGMNMTGVNATNPYGQTWQVQVLQPSSNNLQALVMAVGGDTLPDKVAAQIAKFVGQPGGFIATNDTGIYSGGSGYAFGTYGGWQVSTANYQSVAGGHPAALLTVQAGQVSNNFLYRNAVPGQPQLNQMNTALGMAGNNINNVGALTGHTADLSRDGTAACCNPNGATLYLSEATSSTGRKPTIQFHSQGNAEGYIELSGANEPRRLNLKDNQGAGLGLNTTGQITAPSVATPNGMTITAGGAAFGSDGTNTLVRQNGDLYSQHNNGALASVHAQDFYAAGNVNASGNVTASGGMYTPGTVNATNGVNSNGPISVLQNWWGMLVRDGNGNDNAAAQSAAGSIYVNDIYIRSIGKWASQLGVGDVASMGENGYTVLPSGLIIQWGHYTPYLYGTGATASAFYQKVFPNAVFNCSVTVGYTNTTNDNGPLTLTNCNTNALSVYNTSDAGPVQGFYWMAIGY